MLCGFPQLFHTTVAQALTRSRRLCMILVEALEAGGEAQLVGNPSHVHHRKLATSWKDRCVVSRGIIEPRLHVLVLHPRHSM